MRNNEFCLCGLSALKVDSSLPSSLVKSLKQPNFAVRAWYWASEIKFWTSDVELIFGSC